MARNEDNERLGKGPSGRKEWNYQGDASSGSRCCARVMRYITASRRTLLTSRRRDAGRPVNSQFLWSLRGCGPFVSTFNPWPWLVPSVTVVSLRATVEIRNSACIVRGCCIVLHRVAADRYSRLAGITRASRLVTPKYAHGKT